MHVHSDRRVFIDLFAVYAFMHDYRIARRGHLRGLWKSVANGCSASPHAASLPVGLTWYSNFIAESPYPISDGEYKKSFLPGDMHEHTSSCFVNALAFQSKHC